MVLEELHSQYLQEDNVGEVNIMSLLDFQN